MARAQDSRKRSGIVESAFRAFGERGFRSTTMKTIARASGVAPGSIYTYFRDKRELFRAAAGEGWRVLLSELREALQTDRPLAERLDLLVELAFRKLKDSLPLLRGMLFEASRMQEFHRNLDRFCAVVVSLLEEGRRQGLLDVDDEGAWKGLVRVLVSGVMFTVAIAPEDATDREIRALKSSITALLREHMRVEAGT